MKSSKKRNATLAASGISVAKLWIWSCFRVRFVLKDERQPRVAKFETRVNRFASWKNLGAHVGPSTYYDRRLPRFHAERDDVGDLGVAIETRLAFRFVRYGITRTQTWLLRKDVALRRATNGDGALVAARRRARKLARNKVRLLRKLFILADFLLLRRIRKVDRLVEDTVFRSCSPDCLRSKRRSNWRRSLGDPLVPTPLRRGRTAVKCCATS